ncbi:hypothetical protein C8P63_10283 [Melghirimyces profundicolus]|uniref:Uncharacterized protein n=1 Tax=Melghirimyces profundicolus TaxID=1242148 RepID=A0A2T6C8F7_9BACL|nr:hypothetical protein [Melghirimyces profundicolus]PTX64589.1 hypothetical protein C8P63_10283 [Melghirimyces profundicolus]
MTDLSIVPSDWDEPSMMEKISRQTRARSVRVRDFVYYPYLYLQYRLERNTRLFPKKGRVGCTVDLVSGKEAVVDTVPVIQTRTVPTEKIIGETLSPKTARKQAEAYIYSSVSVGLKWMGTLKLIQEEERVCHRPFWIMTCEWERGDPATVIVDAVSGRYHPLSL